MQHDMTYIVLHSRIATAEKYFTVLTLFLKNLKLYAYKENLAYAKPLLKYVDLLF